MNGASTTQTASTTLAGLLAGRATELPHKTFLRTADASVTYQEAHAAVEAYSSGLWARGIRPGDRVAMLMGNNPAQVLLWFALNRIGAVNVPLNTGLTAALIARSCELVDPAAIIADVDSLHLVPGDALRAVPVFAHGPASSVSALPAGIEPLSHLYYSGPVVDTTVVDDLDPATMLFTSGSTGTPKACVLSHHYLRRAGELHAKYLQLTADDVLFTPFPLFHIDAATLTVSAALACSGTAALSPKFSASRFWDQIRSTGATVFNFMGATANILWKQPPASLDREHRVRLAWGVPMPACEPKWQERFGFPLIEVYGLTDAGVPAYQPLNEPRLPGSCGRVISEYTVRISDGAGGAAPTGSAGEILISSTEPGLLMTEYYAMPEATDTAFRDGWFHTGDLGRLDGNNNLYFVTRSKEVIRRRGENIAAVDIEETIDHHPSVRESAAVGVPSELSEDDIKVFYVLQPDADLSPGELLNHCTQSLPRHMVPRYFQQVPELPKTPTEKIERFKLASRPLTSETWDAEPPRPTTTTEEKSL